VQGGKDDRQNWLGFKLTRMCRKMLTFLTRPHSPPRQALQAPLTLRSAAPVLDRGNQTQGIRSLQNC